MAEDSESDEFMYIQLDIAAIVAALCVLKENGNFFSTLSEENLSFTVRISVKKPVTLHFRRAVHRMLLSK